MNPMAQNQHHSNPLRPSCATPRADSCHKVVDGHTMAVCHGPGFSVPGLSWHLLNKGLSRRLTQGCMQWGVCGSLFVGVHLLLRVKGVSWRRATGLGLWPCGERVGKVVASAFSRGVRWKLEAPHD